MSIQKSCIFCGEKGKISKEHFWPDWLRKYLSVKDNAGNVSEIYSGEGKSPAKLVRRVERQGGLITKKIRVVCQGCNTGWMSRLEENNKPILLASIQGASFCLNEKQIKELALWASVKCIVGEYAENNLWLTPFEDRYLVYKEEKIPEYYRIFIGRHSSTTQSSYIRHSTTISKDISGPNPPLLDGISRNIHCITFLIGSLFFHIFAVRLTNMNTDEFIKYNNIYKLWPTNNKLLNIQTLPHIDEVELNHVSSALEKLISLQSVKYGGSLP